MLSQAFMPVPIPGTNGQTYSIDLQPYFLLENGLNSMATLSMGKAHMLLSDLFRASFSLAQHLDRVERYHNRAKQETEKRRAVIVIDVMQQQLKDKGLSPNDLTRKAVIDIDDEYQQLVAQQADIHSTLKFLKNKFDRFEDAIATVRSITYNLGATQARMNPNLGMSMGANETAPIGVSPQETQPTTQPTKTAYGVSYGKAKYGQEES